MKEIRIYIGLNDSDTLTQKYENSVYISILKKVCFCYHVPFSFSLSEGGYFHENGNYTQEQTLVLSLIDVEESLAVEIAQDLCVFFNQESVMMTDTEVKTIYIKDPEKARCQKNQAE